MYGGGEEMVLEVGEEEMNTDAEERGGRGRVEVVEADRRDPQEQGDGEAGLWGSQRVA